METFAGIVSSISGWLYSYILIALLIAAGLYFTVRTGFVQFRLFGESIRVITEKRSDKESISSFQALMVSTALVPATWLVLPVQSSPAAPVLCSGCG